MNFSHPELTLVDPERVGLLDGHHLSEEQADT